MSCWPIGWTATECKIERGRNGCNFSYICNHMAKEKNKPVPVRFDLKLLEVLKEEEKIDTPQQALNFLAKFWENHRPARDGFTSDLKEVNAPAPVAKVKEPAASAHPS